MMIRLESVERGDNHGDGFAIWLELVNQTVVPIGTGGFCTFYPCKEKFVFLQLFPHTVLMNAYNEPAAIQISSAKFEDSFNGFRHDWTMPKTSIIIAKGREVQMFVALLPNKYQL